jgi:iron complex transport system ATP-binding protein
MTTAYGLRLDGVSATLDSRPILDGVRLEARPGSMVGLIGPNGAGKTTLFRCIAGLLKPSAGTVWITAPEGDRPASAWPARDLARILALVPQDTSVGFAFSTRDIVLMGRHPHLGRFQVEGPDDVGIANAAMREAGVLHLADRPITQLSGGERQMTFVAKALAQEPRILLLDEPVSALDVRHQLEILALARRRADDGACVIVVLHDLNLAARYCDRLALLAGGRVLAEGEPAAVLSRRHLDASYGVNAAVRRDVMLDRLSVTAIQTTADLPGAPRVHVLGGGATAVPVLAHLYRLGAQLSIGPVEEHDPDALLARELGAEVLAWPSFQPLPEEAAMDAGILASLSQVVLATDVPLGPNNQRLATIARTLRARLVRVPGAPPTSGNSLGSHLADDHVLLEDLDALLRGNLDAAGDGIGNAPEPSPHHPVSTGGHR